MVQVLHKKATSVAKRTDYNVLYDNNLYDNSAPDVMLWLLFLGVCVQMMTHYSDVKWFV
jgi:hypothetical protein